MGLIKNNTPNGLFIQHENYVSKGSGWLSAISGVVKGKQFVAMINSILRKDITSIVSYSKKEAGATETMPAITGDPALKLSVFLRDRYSKRRNWLLPITQWRKHAISVVRIAWRICQSMSDWFYWNYYECSKWRCVAYTLMEKYPTPLRDYEEASKVWKEDALLCKSDTKKKRINQPSQIDARSIRHERWLQFIRCWTDLETYRSLVRNVRVS